MYLYIVIKAKILNLMATTIINIETIEATILNEEANVIELSEEPNLDLQNQLIDIDESIVLMF